MTEDINYYILFDNYTHGLALYKLLQLDSIPARISPTPHILQEKVSCGMSLLVMPEDIDAVRACIAEHGAAYHDIAALPCQIKTDRFKFC